MTQRKKWGLGHRLKLVHGIRTLEIFQIDLNMERGAGMKTRDRNPAINLHKNSRRCKVKVIQLKESQFAQKAGGRPSNC